VRERVDHRIVEIVDRCRRLTRRGLDQQLADRPEIERPTAFRLRVGSRLRGCRPRLVAEQQKPAVGVGDRQRRNLILGKAGEQRRGVTGARTRFCSPMSVATLTSVLSRGVSASSPIEAITGFQSFGSNALAVGWASAGFALRVRWRKIAESSSDVCGIVAKWSWRMTLATSATRGA
jgi:hypothetical protein